MEEPWRVRVRIRIRVRASPSGSGSGPSPSSPPPGCLESVCGLGNTSTRTGYYFGSVCASDGWGDAATKLRCNADRTQKGKYGLPIGYHDQSVPFLSLLFPLSPFFSLFSIRPLSALVSELFEPLPFYFLHQISSFSFRRISIVVGGTFTFCSRTRCSGVSSIALRERVESVAADLL